MIDSQGNRRSWRTMREDALAIWQAGVDAVDSRRLMRENVRVVDDEIQVGDTLSLPLNSIGRIAVVGAGKAGAGMAAGLRDALDPNIRTRKQLHGWINVPEDCVRDCGEIVLHAARPAGVNEPTEEGIKGTRRILEIVETLSANDLCFCLLSGGGSALLPAPVDGVSLADKQSITNILSGAGANIQQLNTVRKQLSRVKGQGLARACGAGALITLIISDVIGDPLDIIASGPTAPDNSTPTEALAVLEHFNARAAGAPESIFEYLQSRRNLGGPDESPSCRVEHFVIGNNALAVDAAGAEAERRGYSHAMIAAKTLEGSAESVGRKLAEMAIRMRAKRGPDCLITGGEPTVTLAPPDRRGKGGRNQQLVLAAIKRLLEPPDMARGGVCILAGGTDGEDGPTDAAGAFYDASLLESLQNARIDIDEALDRNNAYPFFDRLGALIKSGPTHTNVCDLRIALVDRRELG